MTEQEKMELGLWYDAMDAEPLAQQRRNADALCLELNSLDRHHEDERAELLRKLMPNKHDTATVRSPVWCDYGFNCYFGEETYLNRNTYLMDDAPIRFGRYCFIGPNCSFYTALHPLLDAERNTGIEKALPITIGDNVWMGGNVVVCPGVTIGSGAVIGAGSVVTRDIPENALAFGNPCRVKRILTEEDSIAAILAQQNGDDTALHS